MHAVGQSKRKYIFTQIYTCLHRRLFSSWWEHTPSIQSRQFALPYTHTYRDPYIRTFTCSQAALAFMIGTHTRFRAQSISYFAYTYIQTHTHKYTFFTGGSCLHDGNTPPTRSKQPSIIVGSLHSGLHRTALRKQSNCYKEAKQLL